MALGCKTESQLTASIAKFELALIILDVSVLFKSWPLSYFNRSEDWRDKRALGILIDTHRYLSFLQIVPFFFMKCIKWSVFIAFIPSLVILEAISMWTLHTIIPIVIVLNLQRDKLNGQNICNLFHPKVDKNYKVSRRCKGGFNRRKK